MNEITSLSVSGGAIDLPLIVGISADALFDLKDRHGERGGTPLRPGPALEVARRLLDLNRSDAEPLVRVILLSNAAPGFARSVYNAFAQERLDITQGSFTGGRPIAALVAAWKIDLFLSNDADEVRTVAATGVAAARLGTPSRSDLPGDEIRLAFDGDADLFDSNHEASVRKYALPRFLDHEPQHALAPMRQTPTARSVFPKLEHIIARHRREDGTGRIRIAVVTADSASAHERVVQTLHGWGAAADEAHCVARSMKTPLLLATEAHIVFDDQKHPAEPAEQAVVHTSEPVASFAE